MRLALCMRGLCKLCVQIVRDVQWTKRHWQLVLQPMRTESTWMCVLIAFHWLCLTQGHSVTQ